jgi:cytochrome c oxidase assembly protein subunit 15
MAARSENTDSDRPWSRRLAWAVALAALPLLLFGGTVTTLRAGMAIDGWWVLEPGRGDHFLLLYPAEKWFRDAGTFTEHTHRLFGTLVGLLSIAFLVVAAVHDRRREVLALAAAGLVAVSAQGALGGFRVLENSQDLAFLHGSFAQAVFALLACSLVVTSRGWQALPRTPCKRAASTRTACWAAAVMVYVQIVVGAWLRHSGAMVPFFLHLVLVVGVIAAVMLAARQLGLAHGDGVAAGVDRTPLRRARVRLYVLLAAQIALGGLATLAVLVLSGGFQGRVSTAEMIFATAHVLFGALLLCQCVAAALWAQRLTATAAEASACAAPSLGGAR